MPAYVDRGTDSCILRR